MSVTVVYLALALVAVVQSAPSSRACWSDGDGFPQGKYWEEGERILRGRYWYNCVNSELVPAGCVTKQNVAVAIGEKMQEGGYEFTCIQDTKGYLYMDPSACIDQWGTVHYPGDTWDHPTAAYWYTCKRTILFDRTYLDVKTVGCLVNRRRFNVGDELEDGPGWWECQERWNGTQLCLKGCMYEGRRLKLNEKVDKGDGFTYQCAKRGELPEVYCESCLVRNERFAPGQRFFKDDAVFECDIMWDNITNTQQKRHRLVGCIERDRTGKVIGEREVGCIWSKEEKGCKYEYRCDDAGQKKTVGCTLSKDGLDFLYIPVGKFTIFNFGGEKSKGAGCREIGGLLEYVEINLDNLEAETVGLAYYSPYSDRK